MTGSLPRKEGVRKERAVTLLNAGARPLAKAEALLMRTRIDFVELKRTGSRQVLPELLDDITRLKSEIEQLETTSSVREVARRTPADRGKQPKAS